MQGQRTRDLGQPVSVNGVRTFDHQLALALASYIPKQLAQRRAKKRLVRARHVSPEQHLADVAANTRHERLGANGRNTQIQV